VISGGSNIAMELGGRGCVNRPKICAGPALLDHLRRTSARNALRWHRWLCAGTPDDVKSAIR